MANILTSLKKFFGGTSKTAKKGRNKKGQFSDGAFTSKEGHEKAYAPKRKTRARRHPSQKRK